MTTRGLAREPLLVCMAPKLGAAGHISLTPKFLVLYSKILDTIRRMPIGHGFLGQRLIYP